MFSVIKSFKQSFTKLKRKFFPLSVMSFLIFISIFFGSCTPHWIPFSYKNLNGEEPTTAKVCIDVSEKSFSKVSDAVKSWDNSIKSWKRLIPIRATKENEDECYYTIKEIAADKDTSQLVLAKAFLGNNEIHLYAGRYEKDVVGIVLHEIGHLLGARHMHDTLMSATIFYGRYSCPDSPTVAQVAIVNAIEPTSFAWCQPNY